MNKIKIYLVFVCILLLNNLFAQNQGNIQTIGIPDGLSSPNVMSVYQDRFGYIWIMTEDGLNRYDGKKIKIYRNDPDDSNSLFSNSVYSAVEDSDGYLWIGGVGFASKYDYATETFEVFNFNSLASNEKGQKVISLFTDSKGRIWGGTFGGTIHKLDNELGTFESTDYNENIELNYTGQIWSITELKNGKILFPNTTSGIFQYDESSGKFSQFMLDNNFSPLKILRIQEDDDGTIWFSGEDIVIRYNPNFYSYKILDGFQIQSKMYHLGYHKVSDDNYIFVSDPLGLIRYNPKTAKVIETIKIGLNPYWFISDKFGMVWIASRGGLIKYDPNSEPFTHVKINPAENQDNRGSVINYMNLDKFDKQSVWMLSAENMLVKYNLKNSSTRLFMFESTATGSQFRFDRFTQNSKGNFLLGSTTRKGIFEYDVQSQKLTGLNEIPMAFSDGFRVRDLAFDQNNNMFIASANGLINYNFSNNRAFMLPTIANRRYSSQTVETIQTALTNAEKLALITEADETKSYNINFSVKEDSYIFIRCLGEGQLDDRSGDLIWDYGILSNSNGDVIFEMQDYLKTFHAGGGNKNRMQYKTMRLKKGEYNLKYTLDSGHSYNNFNAPAPDDSINYGIQVYKITEESYKNIGGLLTTELNKIYAPLGVLTDVEVSRKFSNSIFLSSATQGLFRYNILDSSFTQYTFGELQGSNQKNWLQSSYEDLTGNLWVSSSQGLVWLNPDNGKWRVFTEKDGLPSNNILNTIEDNNGDLWIISLGGLSRFNKNEPSDKWNFVNYDTRDGLTGYSFNGKVVKTPDGEILFIVGDDFHRFMPGKSNTIKPAIIIDDFKISDVSIFSSDSPIKLEKSLMETKEIKLPFNLNDISFNFNIIHYSRPYKNRLFYKMEGFNEKWIESELGTATFTNLDPGNYEFKVRGISADGIRNDEGVSIKIDISPPWWKTTFAYIGYFILFAGLIFSIDRIQRRRILVKERAASAIKEAELRAQLAESENERKSKELEEARQLQLSMLPKELPKLPNLDIAVYMQTATEVGGDYYDFHVGMDGILTVVIGDATGHGLNAGTIVTATKSLFNSYAPNPDILFTFSEISRCIRGLKFRRLSMCLLLLKIEGNTLRMSAAGMPPALIYRNNKRTLEEIMLKGMPLGTSNNFPYQLRETTLQAGDTILLNSDGFPELINDKKEMFGYERVKTTFAEVSDMSSEKIIEHLKDTAKDWTNGNAPDDDVTFVVLKVK